MNIQNSRPWLLDLATKRHSEVEQPGGKYNRVRQHRTFEDPSRTLIAKKADCESEGDL